jgi:hypothetical protein
MNVTKIITMNYKNLFRWRVKKTNPNKPNSKPALLVPYQIGSCRHLVWEAQSNGPILERMNVNFCASGYYKGKQKAVNSEPLSKDW